MQLRGLLLLLWLLGFVVLVVGVVIVCFYFKVEANEPVAQPNHAMQILCVQSSHQLNDILIQRNKVVDDNSYQIDCFLRPEDGWRALIWSNL